MLEVNNLKTHFKTQDGVVKAVDGVSFSLEPGETWSWCFPDELGMLLPDVTGSTRIPPSPLA